MEFEYIFKNHDIQNTIDKYAERYKNKRILVYGAGKFASELFERYDFSKLNIAVIIDKKYDELTNAEFYGYRTDSPYNIKNFDFDAILVANYDFKYFKGIIRKSLKENGICRFMNSHYPKILPIVRYNLKDKWAEYQKAKKVKQYYKNIEIIKETIQNTAKSCGEGLWIGGMSRVTPNTILGEHVSFNGMRIMGNGEVKIGRYFHSGIECLIIASNHNYDTGTEIPYDDNDVPENVEIGDFVWFGSRVMILPGTKIGEGAIIQGGSVVHGEIPPYAIAGGNPAKVFKYRDIEHFQRLKEQGKFHG